MKERLSILIDGVPRELDLNSPSGITLSYKSPIFGDLGKVQASSTYTFNLPLTANNRRVFDSAEDVRKLPSMAMHRLKARYELNGIPVLGEANLYLESFADKYRCVMTWNVIDGLQNLLDNDIALNELPNDGKETTFGIVRDTPMNGWVLTPNDTDVIPNYNCGIPFQLWEVPTSGDGRRSVTVTNFSAYPMPCVPIVNIVSRINSHFGTKIDIAESGHELTDYGVIPLVGIDLNHEQRQLRKAILSAPKITYVNSTIKADDELYFPDFISFGQIDVRVKDWLGVGTFGFSNPGTQPKTVFENVGVRVSVERCSLSIDGNLSAGFQIEGGDDAPTLSVYQLQTYWPDGYKTTGGNSVVRYFWHWVELASIEGVANGTQNGYSRYDFNFSPDGGGELLECENVSSDGRSSPVIFVFSHRCGWITMWKDIEITPLNSNNARGRHPIDIVGNLPDIGCLSFVKTLFHMTASFPMVNDAGQIVCGYYSDLYTNIPHAKDWSDRITTPFSTPPSEVKWKCGDYAQKNFFQMKSDSEQKKDSDEVQDDTYGDGKAILEVANPILPLTKNVIELPFYGPYIRNRKLPAYETGNTMKAWTLEDDVPSGMKKVTYNRLTFVNPKPCVGMLYNRDVIETNNAGQKNVLSTKLSMRVWTFKDDLAETESFKALQKIVANPIVITENLRLNEFDLMELDFSVPVYLSKYCAYFAIISIQYSPFGSCKCELIKLP